MKVTGIPGISKTIIEEKFRCKLEMVVPICAR
jgi:hypothetical protein